MKEYLEVVTVDDILKHDQQQKRKELFSNYVYDNYISQSLAFEIKIKIPNNRHKHLIPAMLYLPHDKQNEEIEHVVIALHGLGSDQNSSTIKAIAAGMTERGHSLISFDFPAHGENEIEENFSVLGCISDCNEVISYARLTFPNAKISLFGSSFGGYIALLLANNKLSDFHRIVLRCPAVNIYDSFDRIVLKPSNSDIKRFIIAKSVMFGFEKQIKLTYDFYTECKTYDLKNVFTNPKNYEINIIHGDRDDVVYLSDVNKFVSDNTPYVSLDVVRHGSHRFDSPEEFEALYNIALELLP